MTMERTGVPADAPTADPPPTDEEPKEDDRTGETRLGTARPEPGRGAERADLTDAGPGETAGAGAVPTRPHRLGRPRHGRGPVAALLAADCLAAAAAAFTAGGARTAVLDLAPALLILLALHQQGGLYRRVPAGSALSELPGLLWRAALAWSAATTVVALVRPELTVGWPRLLGLIAMHVALAALLRGAVHGRQRRRQRRNPRSALVVGTPAGARRVAGVLHEHPEYGMWPVGLVVPRRVAQERADGTADGAPSDDAAHDRPEGPPVPLLAAAEDVTRAVVQNSVSDAVLTRPAQADPDTRALVRLFRTLGCTVWVVDGEAVPGVTWRTEATGHLWGFPCARLDPPPRRRIARAAKRAVDLTVAVLALVAAAPVLALCALAVRVFDGPGVLFRQERVGVHGRPFVMLKFRSLRPADEHESATRWNVAGDRRMTPVGRLLRRTSLDELPQLWNVLCGDMSLVGPRPERPYFVQQFTTAHPGYAARDRMPVGITGLAQVHGLRGDTSIEDRARFDNHYIDTWSLWQDVQILLRTAGSVFRLGGS